MDHMTGMLAADPAQTAQAGLLKMRNAYSLYVQEEATASRTPLPFPEWVSAVRAQAGAAPAAAMPVRGGPSSSFQDPYEVQQAKRRAQQEAEFRAAQVAAREKRQGGMITGK